MELGARASDENNGKMRRAGDRRGEGGGEMRGETAVTGMGKQ